MKTTETKRKTELKIVPKTENKKVIENHKKAATHFEAAAKSHLKAAKHHKNGNYEKAAKCTVEAYDHVSLANEVRKEDVRHHALQK